MDPEVRNCFNRNFVMGCTGDRDYEWYPGDARDTFLANNPGGEGSGFWCHGMQNTFTNNVSCNNRIGFNAFCFSTLNYNYPSVPGGVEDTFFDPRLAVPSQFSGNVVCSNAINGLEFWALPDTGTWQADCWHNGADQVVLGGGVPASLSFDHLRTLSDGGDIGSAIHSSAGYAFVIKLANSRLEGSGTGLLTTKVRYEVSNTTLQNGLNIDWDLVGYEGWGGPSQGVSVINCKGVPWTAGDPNIEC